MTIRFEANSPELEDEARSLAAKFEAEGEEVEVWGPIRKAAGIEQVVPEILKIYFAYEIGKHVFPRVDLFLAEWFTERPKRSRPPLQVQLYDQDETLITTRNFGGPDSYSDPMSNQLWNLYEATEDRLEEDERNLIRAAADGIELLEAALKAAKRRREGG